MVLLDRIIQNPSCGIETAEEPLFNDLIETPCFVVAVRGVLRLLHPRSVKTPIDEQSSAEVRRRIVNNRPDTGEPIIPVVVGDLIVPHKHPGNEEIVDASM